MIKLANPLLQSLFACFKSLFACYIYITICAAKTAALCEGSVGVCRFAFFGDSKFKWCMLIARNVFCFGYLCGNINNAEKYWKQCNFYYNGKKSWMSSKSYEKLLRMRGQEENRMRFLEMLLREL